MAEVEEVEEEVEEGVRGGGDESREAGKSKWREVEENEGEKDVQIAAYREWERVEMRGRKKAGLVRVKKKKTFFFVYIGFLPSFPFIPL